jgi:DNA-directed RNA polymerase subunit RPC12/RpoP
MANPDATPDAPRCLECGHPFDAAELSAMEATEGETKLSCRSCGTRNVLRSAPQPGLDHHPAVEVLRTESASTDSARVFEETVEPGTRVHPVSAGKSN